MGSLFNWYCPNEECSFTVEMVSGGKDRGMASLTETRICTKCKYIGDYVVGIQDRGWRLRKFLEGSYDTSEKENKPGFAPIINKDPNPMCRICNEKTEPWDCHCPNCGGIMLRGTEEIRWD